jgi:hypothetical protein
VAAAEVDGVAFPQMLNVEGRDGDEVGLQFGEAPLSGGRGSPGWRGWRSRCPD